MDELLNKYKTREDLEFERICKEMADLHSKKNRAYGNAFAKMFEKSGIRYASDKMSEKMLRIETLSKDATIDDFGESIMDSVFDLACYAVMTIAEVNRRKNDDN